ncbi:glucuronate isomerase [Fulvivirgaceae bacterium BMA10]|uniref:Uronate isomerase n=1 Tax=Splendidivirga corallicola TaxID=3051826 RepID=A0ABT8KWG5_9BACT|nr:glucuronate isomerase [Fulvivirgaceae bacterium BMA10]
MKEFLDQDFLLNTSTAQKLYHDYAANLPIIDYHCHLSAEEIANDKTFENLTQIWLEGDHYKWRALRALGVSERFITGEASAYEKFMKWAEVVPQTLRNPLYHWTHMELKFPFGVNKLLNKQSAKEIYDHCTDLLNTSAFSARNLLKKYDVKVVCTTDDPIDSLEHHQKICEEDFEIRVLPTFRPDRAMAIEEVTGFNIYLDKLQEITGYTIDSYQDYLGAIKLRHDYFASSGCCISDHGLDQIYSEDFSDQEIAAIFAKARQCQKLEKLDVLKFKSAMLLFFAELDHEKGWVQQFHIGAYRNGNARMLKALGPDSGFDSIGDNLHASSLIKFLDTLEKDEKLAQTIVYNLNPRDNEMMASIMGSFNDGSVRGKMQLGSAWWFLDQKDGMEKQINALSNLGMLSCFVGMLTDSRSFLSYSRHEYFRRILCNLIGDDVEKGLLPNDMETLGELVKNVCYVNAKNYFKFGKEIKLTQLI